MQNVQSEVDLEKIERLARSTRKWAEQYAEKNGFTPDLCCLCAIASANLFKRLKNSGVENVYIAYNPNHCFVRVGEYLVDVTATQFSFDEHPKIVITKYRTRKKFFYWRTVRKYSRIETLRKTQQNVGWPRNQTV